MSTRPVEAVQRKAANVPPKRMLPLTMLAPTTAVPSAETPQASLCADPPGRSPSPVKVGCARAAEHARPVAEAMTRAGERRVGVRMSNLLLSLSLWGRRTPPPPRRERSAQAEQRSGARRGDEGEPARSGRGSPTSEEHRSLPRPQVDRVDVARTALDRVRRSRGVEPQREEREA